MHSEVRGVRRHLDLCPGRNKASEEALCAKPDLVAAGVGADWDEAALSWFESQPRRRRGCAEDARDGWELASWVGDEGGDVVGEASHAPSGGEDAAQQG